MTNEQYQELGGENLVHRVWVERNGRVVGVSDQTVDGVTKMLATNKVVKIECLGYTIESKARECERWGCE